MQTCKIIAPHLDSRCCILLLTLLAIGVIGPSLSCPSGCHCEKEDHQPFGDLLSITCKDLTSIPDLSVLREISMGKNLRFEDHSIEAITDSDFPAGLNITVLNLSRNKGLRISDKAFLNLGSSLKKLKLEAIDLPFNDTLRMFDPLFSLQELSLSYNNKHPYVAGAVQDIDAPLLQGEVAKSLKKLMLAFCGIRTLSATSLGNLEKLENLDLSNNWFKTVPEVIKHLPSIKYLEMFYCAIESIKNDDFSQLTHLQALDLSSNRNLKTIDEKAFIGCENSLEKLVLSRCSLTDIPTAALRKLKKLTHLDVSENRFTSIQPGAFQGDYKLKELLISAPNLQFNLNMFQGQEENIIDLSIPRMGLKSVPLEPISKLKKLGRLSLDHNEITVLPEKAFDGITATVLYLGNNPLSKIDAGAFDGLPPNLVINFRNTNLDDIDFLIGYPESTIETVDLGHSKLVCRCSMKSSLNATLNVRIYGSCSKGDLTIPISSTRLEGILEQACEEERAAGNVGTRPVKNDHLYFILSTGIVLVVGHYLPKWFTY